MRAVWPCPAHYPDGDVRTKLLRRRLHANPLSLSTSLHACAHACAHALSEHSRALVATPGRPVGPGARNYKRGPSLSFCPCPHRCLPPISRHRLCFLPLRRCQAISPHLSPCAGPGAPQGPRAAPKPAQVTSSPPLSSGTVDRAPVSSAPPLPAFLALSWSSRPCQAGSSCAFGAHGEDLAVARAVAARCRARHGRAWWAHRRLSRPR
jgi:hypothetical protein